jgi:hypothetical protein
MRRKPIAEINTTTNFCHRTQPSHDEEYHNFMSDEINLLLNVRKERLRRLVGIKLNFLAFIKPELEI